MIAFELRRFSAPVIVDLVDDFALRRGLQGEHPRPIGGLSYTIPARVVGGVRTAIDPPIVPVIIANPSGYALFFGATRPGPVRRGRLAPGDYILRVESPAYQAAEIALTIPDLPGSAIAPATTSLEPGYAYPFPDGTTLLRGQAVATDGSGISGVAVSVQGQANGPTYLTDATGVWALDFPATTASGPVTVVLQPPTGASSTVAANLVAGAEVVLLATALRGLAFEFDGRPATGATVSVSGQAATVAVGPDGSWTYLLPASPPPPATVTLTATAADGRVVTVPNIPITASATKTLASIRFPRP